MLKDGRANVVHRCPFTIQLRYGTTNGTQEITLGVDAGSKQMGLSATTKKKELYSADVELRKDIVDLISIRRENRRNRKTRYRKPRFHNRKKKEGWLTPSIQQKIQCHLQAVKNVY